MNIFWLDSDLEKAAMYHCDKHVVKMILEYTQLLSGVLHSLNRDYGLKIDTGELYKPTHMNHPCAVWARKTSGNYGLLTVLLCALLAEYTYRYGKVHKSSTVAINLAKHYPAVESLLPVESTVPPQCMPDEFKDKVVVAAYRNYYLHKSNSIDMRWTKRYKPEWLEVAI